MSDLRPHARFGTADLHLHTSHGDGMADAATLLAHVDAHTDLDVIAITDHDDVRGALLAREVHARGNYRFALVPGIELTTRAGHLLALWVEEPLAPLRPLHESIAAIHRAGGLAVIPHPMSYLTRSVGQRALERLLALDDPEVTPDAIEVANPSPAGRQAGGKARHLNRTRYGLAETGSSDTHFPEEAGTARTLFPGHTPEALRAALLTKETRPAMLGAVPLRRLGARRLVLQQVRGLSTTPRKVVAFQARRIAAWPAGAEAREVRA